MRIKVCCIQTREEARQAIRAGVHALGLVAPMQVGRYSIERESIREIVEIIPPTFSAIVLTSETDARAVAELQCETQAHALQLVGDIDPDEVARVAEQRPGIPLFKTIHVADPRTVATALDYDDVANALLLDTKVEVESGEALGGTGVAHDWNVSREIVERCSRPVFLAGGLSPGNVEEAIRRVRPFGVDICSKLRPEGRLDPDLLRLFVDRVTRASSSPGAEPGTAHSTEVDC